VWSQAYVVFDECDTDKSGTIGRAEGEVMLDKLIDLDNGSQRGAESGKGSKPLFCTAASVPPVMRRQVKGLTPRWFAHQGDTHTHT